MPARLAHGVGVERVGMRDGCQGETRPSGAQDPVIHVDHGAGGQEEADADRAEECPDRPAQGCAVCRSVGDAGDGGKTDDEGEDRERGVEALGVKPVLPVATLGPVVSDRAAHPTRVSGRADARG